MKKANMAVSGCLILALLLLTGCALQTVDETVRAAKALERV